MHRLASKLARSCLLLVVVLMSSFIAHGVNQSALVSQEKQKPALSHYVHNQLIIKLTRGRTIDDVQALNRINDVVNSENIIHGRASRADLDRLYLL